MKFKLFVCQLVAACKKYNGIVFTYKHDNAINVANDDEINNS